MEFGTFDYIYLMAVGFGVASFVMVVFWALTGRAMGFALGSQGATPLAPLSIVLRLVAGPAILVRNAFVSGMSMKSDPIWLVVGIIVATVWAATSGALVVESFGPLASME